MANTEPTMVLVHGAFADASSFARVIPELLADGLPVVAPAVPMRSLAADAAYVASVIRQIDGPVILVGRLRVHEGARHSRFVAGERTYLERGLRNAQRRTADQHLISRPMQPAGGVVS